MVAQSLSVSRRVASAASRGTLPSGHGDADIVLVLRSVTEFVTYLRLVPTRQLQPKGCRTQRPSCCACKMAGATSGHLPSYAGNAKMFSNYQWQKLIRLFCSSLWQIGTAEVLRNSEEK